MAAVWTWLTTNYLAVAVALLAVDRLLIQLFPTNTVFQGISNFLTGLGAK